MLRKIIHTGALLIVWSLALGVWDSARAQGGYDPSVQTAALLYDEARTVYLTNLERRAIGVPPLRWNLQMTHAARWYSWDSTENRPWGFCGHQDTQGHWPDYRIKAFGYLGFGGAENAFCGYVTPEDAVRGWMNSPGHRGNILDPNSREIGLGYYRRSGDGRGYVTQDFGYDTEYPPVVIENEALSTTTPAVNLYIYDRLPEGGFARLDKASEMMVSNTQQFCGGSWETYKPDKAWTLPPGTGWREVYVRTRDKFNRSLTASDSIYLGANLPQNELGDAQMSTTQSSVTLYNLNGGGLPQVRLSLGWLADDTDGSFNKWWGNGARVSDAAAWGGTAYRLYPGDGDSFAWVYDTGFFRDMPMTAYFRLKVNDNTSSSEVARLSVKGGGTEYGPLILQGTDFTAPNQYQEFALDFTFNSNPDDPFLIFEFTRTANADLYVDAVSIFTPPQPITSPLTWAVPGGNYRGQGVWVRYTNGSQFTAFSEASTTPQTYKAISGNAGAGGVTLSYFDGTARAVTADSSGNYCIAVPPGWSGTVTVSKAGYWFNPVNRSYSNVQSDQPGQDYTASNTWVGSVSITSSRSVAAVGRPHVGDEIASYNGFSSGSLTAYIPMLFKDAFGGSYDSALYVQNMSPSQSAHVTVRYFDAGGGLTCTRPVDVIAPQASHGYWLPSEACLPAGWVGAAVVTSSDQPIVAVARPHIGTEVMTYNGFASGGLAIHLPMLFKAAFGGTYDSAFYVQNTDPANDAHVTIRYYDTSGSLTCTSPVDTIAPLASHGYWVPSETCLPAGWVGGAVITSSDHPVVSVVRPHIGTQVTTYNGFLSGSTVSYMPMLFKNAFGGSYDSALYIQNIDPNSGHAAHITIDYYDSSGGLSCRKAGETIAPLSSKGYWVPGESCLPEGWVGAAVVSSADYPVVTVGRPHIGAQVTAYDGLPAGNTAVSVPMLFKNMWGNYNSAFYIQNTSAVGAANVTLKFYDVDGNLRCMRTDSLPALATQGYWLPAVTCMP